MIYQTLPNAINLVFCVVLLFMAMRIKGHSLSKKLARLGFLLVMSFSLGNTISWNVIASAPVNPIAMWFVLSFTMLVWTVWAFVHNSAQRYTTQYN